MLGAIDIGGTKIAVGLVRDDGTMVDAQSWATEPSASFDADITRIHAALESMCSRHSADLSAIGAAVTGPVNAQSGVLGNNAFLPHWSGQSLTTALRDTFGIPAFAENDAVAAAVGEAVWGAGQNLHSFIYVTVSTGIGCGIVLEGKVLRGAEGAHGENGHQVIDLDPQAPLCFCGARGCWESLASGTAMTRRWRTACPDSEWTVKEICDAARTGDRDAREAVALEGWYLGVGIANLITHFVPEGIALGGGVMESFDLFLPHIQQQVQAQCGLVPWQRTRIVRAHFRYHAALVGAAALCVSGRH